MGESIFAIIIILFIIIFGLVFYSNVQEEDFNEQRSKFDDLDSIALAQFIGTLPELACAELEITENSCFDTTKLDAFETMLKSEAILTEEYYATQLGTITIYVQEIYPGKRKWVLYNNSLNESIANVRQVITPLSLQHGITKDTAFGVLFITAYDRR